MLSNTPFSSVPYGLGAALSDRGFTELTAIQQAVLSDDAKGRDLRMSSKTGSGKTVALGLVLAQNLGSRSGDNKSPQALVIAPTRELAIQVGGELEWLLRPLGIRHAVVTGGTNIRNDFQSLKRNPALVIGTPGRLVDHTKRGSLDLSATSTVVLDEADEMLDMGFREDLELLLEATPEQRSTHLVSATFPRTVLGLANRYQRDALPIQGSPNGKPNEDIKHVALSIHQRDRESALVNLLLASGPTRTLVFVRTRAATTQVAEQLRQAGFSAAALSGEMGQRERIATLESFRTGTIEVLVATDVAARGLDINDVSQVVHFDLPENAQGFTHRSGRTGRAGNQGTSIMLVTPPNRSRAVRMTDHLRIKLEWQPVPTAKEIRRANETRLLSQMTVIEPGQESDRVLAQKLLEQHDSVDLVAALLGRGDYHGPCEPRKIQDAVAPRAKNQRPQNDQRSGRHDSSRPGKPRNRDAYQRFFVSWGTKKGASPSRLVAMLCRRGNIRSNQIGTIEVGPVSSVVEVANEVTPAFKDAVKKPDPRSPGTHIRLFRNKPAQKTA